MNKETKILIEEIFDGSPTDYSIPCQKLRILMQTLNLRFGQNSLGKNSLGNLPQTFQENLDLSPPGIFKTYVQTVISAIYSIKGSYENCLYIKKLIDLQASEPTLKSISFWPTDNNNLFNAYAYPGGLDLRVRILKDEFTNAFTLESGRLGGFILEEYEIIFAICDEKTGYMIWSESFHTMDQSSIYLPLGYEFDPYEEASKSSKPLPQVLYAHRHSTIYFAGSTGKILVLNAETGEELEPLILEPTPIYILKISKSGKLFVGQDFLDTENGLGKEGTLTKIDLSTETVEWIQPLDQYFSSEFSKGKVICHEDGIYIQ